MVLVVLGFLRRIARLICICVGPRRYNLVFAVVVFVVDVRIHSLYRVACFVVALRRKPSVGCQVRNVRCCLFGLSDVVWLGVLLDYVKPIGLHVLDFGN